MTVASTLGAVSETAPLVFNRGLERETLRVSPAGTLSMTEHPESLGSKLTHPHITTDFGEAQLELITGVHRSAESALAELLRVHRFVYSGLPGNETLWSASMPCVMAGGEDVRVACYGKSNLGRLKTTYRKGLGLRYGRAMQAICAVHYNFSLSDEMFAALHLIEGGTESKRDYRARRYFDLMRNFRRWGWLLTYLFGASPAVCNSFVKDRLHDLQVFDEDTAYLPYATSLRSGSLGYHSDIQTSLINICYNSLDNYVTGLARAICRTHPDYAAAGLHGEKGRQQINAGLLQSEAEFYSSIRAKCVPSKGTNPLQSLKDKGVDYVEVRLLDVNPYLPLGIDKAEVDFIDTFLTCCLLSASPCHDDRLCKEVTANLCTTALYGRQPGVRLVDRGNERALKDWGGQLLDELAPVAQVLDSASGEGRYSAALVAQQDKLQNADLTPSGRMLLDMREKTTAFVGFAMDRSLAHKSSLDPGALSRDLLDHFDELGAASRRDQLASEAADEVSFEEYLAGFQAGYQSLLTAS